MIAILQIVLPVFLVVGAGFAAVRLFGFERSAVDGLMAFAVRFAVPILLFGKVARLDLARSFDPGLLLAFYAGAWICFATGVALARSRFARRPGEAVAIGFSALFSNTLLLGLPILTRAYGEAETAAAVAIIAVHAPTNYLLGIVTMEIARRDGAPPLETARKTLAAIFSNALALGIGAGLALNLAGLTMPGFVSDAVDMIATAALPAALFGLGGALTRHRLRSDLREAGLIAGLSTLLHPLIALIAGLLLGLPDPFLRAAVILAAMPTGMNGYVFAAQYRRAEGACASGVLLGTAAAVATASVWLWLLGVIAP